MGFPYHSNSISIPQQQLSSGSLGRATAHGLVFLGGRALPSPQCMNGMMTIISMSLTRGHRAYVFYPWRSSNNSDLRP